MKQHKYKQNQKSIFLEKFLIFAKIPKNIEKLLSGELRTDEEKKKLEERRKKDEAEKAERLKKEKEEGKKPKTEKEKIRHNLSDSTYQHISKIINRDSSKITIDGLIIKVSEKQREFLLAAIANGNLPDSVILNSDGEPESLIITFLKDLSSSLYEDQAFKYLAKLSDPTSNKMEGSKIYNYLKAKKEIYKIAEETTEAQQIHSDTLIGASHSLQSAKIESIVETKTYNWQQEEFPEELIEIHKSVKDVDQKIKTKKRKLELLYKDAKTNTAEISRILKEIEKLETKIAPESEEFMRLFHMYQERNLNRYRTLQDRVKPVLGFDLNTIGKITIPESYNSEEKYLDIKSIYFESDEKDENPHSLTPHQEWLEKRKNPIGSLKIVFKEDGLTRDLGFIEFLKYIKKIDAYKKIDSVEDLNNDLFLETRTKALEVGDTFTTKNILNTNDFKEEKIIKKPQIKIVKINKERKEIELEEAVLFAGEQRKTIPFGVFSSLIIKGGYYRDLKENEDEQTIIDRLNKKNEQEYAALLKRADIDFTEEEKNIKIEHKILAPGEIRLVKNNGQPALLYKNEDGKVFTRILSENERDMAWLAEKKDLQSPYIDTLPEKSKTIPPELRRRLSEKYKKLITSPPSNPEQSLSWELVDDGHNYAQAVNKNEIEDIQSGQYTDIDDPDEAYQRQLEELNKEPGVSPPTEASSQDLAYSPASQTSEKLPTEQIGEKKKEIYAKEALPYNVVNKVGGMRTIERGYLDSLWQDTNVLSASDMWEMMKSMYEYYQRNFERKQKNKYASVATDAPFFGPEMQRIKNAAETEQVNQFKEGLDNESISFIKEKIIKTKNIDEMKACFNTLTEKGQLRWDDVELWKNLNKFLDSGYRIPIPGDGDPYRQISETDTRTGMDFLNEAIDSIWGEGQYSDWYSANKSAFDSKAKGFYEKGNELEGINGGHQRLLSQLLKRHKEGKYVDPHEYEGLIRHAIEYGKSSMQAKLYYIVEGIAAENPSGQTLLSLDRIAHISGDLLPNFPMLDYLTWTPNRSDGKSSKWALQDFQEFRKYFDGNDSMNSEPNKRVDDFLWEYISTNDWVKKRVNKSLRNGEKIDHDDMFFYIPPVTENVMESTCKGQAGGGKKFLTTEGYANVFPGMSQYMRTLGEKDDRTNMLEAVKSYVRFESIMDGRWQKGNASFERFDDATFKSSAVVTPGVKVSYYQKELNGLIKELLDAYAYDTNTGTELSNKLIKIRVLMYNTTPGTSRTKDNSVEQDKIQRALEDFSKVFSAAVKTDGGLKMSAIMSRKNLRGMPDFVSDEEKEARRAQMEADAQ